MAKSFVPETIQAQPKVRKLARGIWRLEMKMTKAKKMLTSLFIKLARWFKRAAQTLSVPADKGSRTAPYCAAHASWQIVPDLIPIRFNHPLKILYGRLENADKSYLAEYRHHSSC